MIHGVGTDIVSVARMEASLQRFGERFVARVLAPEELEAYRANVRKANFLARRFAAKEALVKAMGTGFVDGMALSQIAVDHDDLGRPLLRLGGAVERRYRALGIGGAHLSISDERDYAVAFVTLLAGEAKRP